MRRITVPAALGFLALASAAYAHPKLVSSTPAPNATVSKPSRIELRFSERLMSKFSGADLAMTGMAGMNHAPVKVASTAMVAGDGRTLIVTPKSSLGAGRYSVTYRVVSADTHRINGTLAFTVK